MGKQKHLVVGQPNYTDTSQYNFDDNETSDFSYENSTGLPINRDKFVKKDLYTTTFTDPINTAIISENIKFEGLPFIRINSLRIANSGVDHVIRGIKIEGWICSKSTYDPYIQSYNGLSMPAGTRFFSYSPGNVSEYSDLGNLNFLEGENIVENFATTADGSISGPTFTNSDTAFAPIVALTKNSAGGGELMKIIDEVTQNPIYIVIRMQAEADRSWGSDKCKRRITTFKLDNLDFFNLEGGVSGTSITFGFDDIPRKSVEGGGGTGADEAPRFKVSNINVTISTLPGTENENLTPEAAAVVGNVLPPTKWFGFQGDLSYFLDLSSKRQLNNNLPSGTGNGTNIMFPEYFVRTDIGMVNSNRFSQHIGTLPPNYTDCQSYYTIEDASADGFITPSAPTTITFNPLAVTGSIQTLDVRVPGNYFYFVIDWDDSENKIKTLDHFEKARPNNVPDLLELQQENLYILKKLFIPDNQYQAVVNSPAGEPPLTNTYNTPGIKNLKFVTFSEEEGEVGRWKLVTSRFFLDVPYNQYPVFEDIAGSNYTTIPWPYTTALIGGISKDSKYKKSVQDTLSSGNISNSDIIDEKLLISDLENDEMGQNILSFDLEQVRFFGTPNDLNTLLNIPIVIETTETTETTEEVAETVEATS